jgi:hypothetical protein
MRLVWRFWKAEKDAGNPDWFEDEDKAWDEWEND